MRIDLVVEDLRLISLLFSVVLVRAPCEIHIYIEHKELYLFLYQYLHADSYIYSLLANQTMISVVGPYDYYSTCSIEHVVISILCT